MTNAEFKTLLNLEKYFSDNVITLPRSGEKTKPHKVVSDSTRDIFLLDLDRRSSITLTKKKLQERHVNTETIMIRLEIDCPPHINNDGTRTSRNHIHIFDEKSKSGNIAYDLSGEYGKLFTNIDDFVTTFYDFCKMCNIDTKNVNIQGVI